jgi:hypothetical protein
MEMILMGLLTALAILVVMWKMNIRRWLAFEVPLDIMVTVGLGALGAATGTISGLMIGIISGLIFSLVFRALRNLLGYEILTMKGWQRRQGRWRVSDETLKKLKDRITENA